MEDINVVDDGSWSVTFSQKENCIYIRTTDYHADPLKLSKYKLEELAGLFESRPTKCLPKPSDTQEIATQNGWTMGISRKNKQLFCESNDGHSKPLVFSRHDLYRYGKMMNKRVKTKR